MRYWRNTSRDALERCRCQNLRSKANEHLLLTFSARHFLELFSWQCLPRASGLAGRGNVGNPAEACFHEFSQGLNYCKSRMFARRGINVRIGNTEISRRADSRIPDE